EIVQRNLTITTLFDDPVLEFAGDGIDPYYKWIEITLDFDPSAPQPRYRMNGGAWQTYTEPMLFEQPGNFLIEYRNGSTQPIFSKSFVIVEDPEEPIISIEGTQEGLFFIDETTLTILKQDEFDTISYRIHNGTNWTNWLTYDAPLQFKQNRDFTIEYKAINRAGIETEVSDVRIRVRIPAVEDNPFVIRNGENVYYYNTTTPVALPT